MEVLKLTNQDYFVTIDDYLDVHLKNKTPDCILYSKDSGEFIIHKELFSQTNFLREILSSAKENYCGMLEILCPCTKEELGHLVKAEQLTWSMVFFLKRSLSTERALTEKASLIPWDATVV